MNSLPTSHVSAGASRDIPSLDGLRAISILLVIFGHSVGTRYFPLHNKNEFIGAEAHFGVQVFFVISGFLISSLLKKELDKRRQISLPKFYLRRFFRIFPAFYVFGAAVALANYVGWIVLNPSDLLHSLTYTMNLQQDPSWWIGHTWSLSTEEQFYILWPAIIVFLTWSRAMGVAALIGLWPAIRFLVLHFRPGWASPAWSYLPNGMDSIAFGCLLAGLRPWLHNQSSYLRFLRSGWVWLLLLLPTLHVLSVQENRIHFLLGFTVNAATAVLIDRCITFWGGTVGKFLNCQPVRSVGVISYSLYLWQQLFLVFRGTVFITYFPVNLVCVSGAALLSYYCVERPFLRLRHRIETNIYANHEVRIDTLLPQVWRRGAL